MSLKSNIEFLIQVHKDCIEILKNNNSWYTPQLTLETEIKRLQTDLDKMGADADKDGCTLYGDAYSGLSGACAICDVAEGCKIKTESNWEAENQVI